MKGFFEFLRSLGPARLGAMGAVAAIMVGFLAFITLRFSAETMAPLYTDLTFDDSAAIVSELEARNIPYQTRRDGSAILVPSDDVLHLRFQLAEQGLPTGGSVGYEIFDKTDTLGATNFVQNINHLRALEGELTRTIRAIDRVVAARVHLVIPERELFRRERKDPSASIVIKSRGALDSSQIKAIQHLVATAVEGLDPRRVSIVDETGRLLASGVASDNAAGVAGDSDERNLAFETRLKREIEEILTSVVGPGRARVEVSAELDFNRITETSEEFDPEGQVVRSTQTREETSSSSEDENGVTAGNQLPNADQQAADGAPSNQQASSSTEEIVNYEVSKTTKTQVLEAGRIKRLSVAVLVDGVYTPDAQGNLSYQPRPAEEMDRIAALVRSAVGFDQTRGDLVEVVNLRFAERPDLLAGSEDGPGLFDFTKADIMQLIELGVTLLLGLLVLLFAVRPLLKRVFAESDPAQATSPEGTPALNADGTPALEGPAGAEGEGALALAGAAGTDENIVANLEWIEKAKADGAVQLKTIQHVSELIEEYPNDAVALVRSWLQEAA
ncbi:MAG: flagellar basal-body MS-ring/collar protein FliF [Pseudomonadota bacterium]